MMRACCLAQLIMQCVYTVYVYIFSSSSHCLLADAYSSDQPNKRWVTTNTSNRKNIKNISTLTHETLHMLQ